MLLRCSFAPNNDLPLFCSVRCLLLSVSRNFLDSFREVGPDWLSLPGYFKSHGYTTFGSGKTCVAGCSFVQIACLWLRLLCHCCLASKPTPSSFVCRYNDHSPYFTFDLSYHPGLPPHDDGNRSWTSALPYEDFPDVGPCESTYFSGDDRSLVCPHSSTNLSLFMDYRNLEDLARKLDYALDAQAATGAPFFLAFGAHKPHLPFRFPTVFNGTNVWEAYGPTGDIAMPTHEVFPTNMPTIALPYSIDGNSSVRSSAQS